MLIEPADGDVPSVGDVPPDAHARSSRRVAERVADLSGWAYVAVVVWLLLSMLLGITGPTVFTVMLQGITPLLFVPLVVLTPFALWRRRLALAVTCAALVLAGVALVAPRLVHRGVPGWAATAAQLTVLEANVYDGNAEPAAAAAALLARHADVMVLVEMTPNFLHALSAAGVEKQYAYRYVDELPTGSTNVEGIYSRLPLDAQHPVTAGHETFDSAHVVVGTGGLTLVVVHIDSALHGVGEWNDELASVRRFARSTSGAVAVVGDFNATRWNPPLADFLDAGFHDGHEDVGRGLSMSWPDRSFPFAFVRIDHALVRGDVAVLRMDDVEVLGSDHGGFLATLAVR